MYSKIRLIFCALLAICLGSVAHADSSANFGEIYQLLRTNLDGVNPGQLDNAAVKGLMNQFPGQVMLVDDTTTNAATLISNNVLSAWYEGCAYLRIGAISAETPEKLRAALAHLSTTNKTNWNGIVLDLRFASGNDYAAAGAVADCFLNSDDVLLQWNGGAAHATAKTNSLHGPLAILVNQKTASAAEALAAALHQQDTGILIGSATAGQAMLFKEFSLTNGTHLRVATGQIKLKDGSVLNHPLLPDIAVDSTLADDTAHLGDPYKELASTLKKQASKSSVTNTNQPQRRIINEAELVRERRAGESLDGDDEADVPTIPEPTRPVVQDSALAHALDFLKGMAVLQLSRPG